MGSFDEVLVPCPKCNAIERCQSKGGDCRFREYDLDEAPVDVLSDVNRHAPFTCGACGCKFEVKIKAMAYAQVVSSGGEVDE